MDIQHRILEAAARVFAEGGFRGATTRRIAQEAGVNEITLFRHFGSKERLLLAAIAVVDRVPREATLPARPRDPRAELLTWVRHEMDHLLDRRSLICACMAEISEHPELVPPATTRSPRSGPCATTWPRCRRRASPRRRSIPARPRPC